MMTDAIRPKGRLNPFLTIPEESMRVQFRYEVVENVGSLLERMKPRGQQPWITSSLWTSSGGRVARCDHAGEFLARVGGLFHLEPRGSRERMRSRVALLRKTTMQRLRWRSNGWFESYSLPSPFPRTSQRRGQSITRISTDSSR